MRSSRSHHHLDNDNRRNNDYHYHVGRNQHNHLDSNGHMSIDYRSNKRSNLVLNSSSSPSSTNLIKRMKSGTSSSSSSIPSNNNNLYSIHSRQSSKLSKSSASNAITAKPSTVTSSMSSSMTTTIANSPNECHLLNFNGYELEESEALIENSPNTKSDENLAQYKQITSNIKEIVLKILEIKKSNSKKSCDDEKELSSSSATKLSEIDENLKFNGVIKLMELKHSNRLFKYRIREARNKIMMAKDKVDQINLQLQNIEYEKTHLQKEQKTCASFRSKDEKLELVSEMKFIQSKDFPENMRHLCIVANSNDTQEHCVDKNANSEELHRLHVARLNWELKQRKLSESQLKLAEESRFRLEVEISARKRTLAQFQPTLESIINAAKPLTSQLQIPLQIYDHENIMTSYLPQPLYVLYIQLCAFKNAFNANYDVIIEGSAEETQEYEAKLRNQSNIYLMTIDKCKYDDEDDNNDGSDGTLVLNSTIKNRLLDDDDDDEREHRTQKPKKSRYHSHHKSDPSNRNLDAIEKNTSDNKSIDVQKNDIECEKSKLLQCYPIKIVLILKYRHYQLRCSFKFFDKLELIGFHYEIESNNKNEDLFAEFSVIDYESNIFSKLFTSNDDGCNCPNETLTHLLRRFGLHSFTEILNTTGYTFDWAQRIAGIEFLKPNERPFRASNGIIRVKSSIANGCIDQAIRSLSKRFKNRINLQEQLREIFVRRESYLGKVLKKPNSHIAFCQRITSNELIEEINPKSKENLIDYFDHLDNDPNESIADDLFNANNFMMKLLIRNESKNSAMNEDDSNQCYEFKVFVIIPTEYPDKWPFFLISLVKNIGLKGIFLFRSWIRSLEEQINVLLPQRFYHLSLASNLDESENDVAGESLSFSKNLLLKQITELRYGLDSIIDSHQEFVQKSSQTLLSISSDSVGLIRQQCLSTARANRSTLINGHDHSLNFDKFPSIE
ncbi:congested-like trachea protein [Sarcoptes scabiei]|nr:congested-like trachea protein [Sarcoptes scabiei]